MWIYWTILCNLSMMSHSCAAFVIVSFYFIVVAAKYANIFNCPTVLSTQESIFALILDISVICFDCSFSFERILS